MGDFNLKKKMKRNILGEKMWKCLMSTFYTLCKKRAKSIFNFVAPDLVNPL